MGRATFGQKEDSGWRHFPQAGNLTAEDSRQAVLKHLQEFANWMDMVGAREYARFACEVDIQLATV